MTFKVKIEERPVEAYVTRFLLELLFCAIIVRYRIHANN